MSSSVCMYMFCLNFAFSHEKWEPIPAKNHSDVPSAIEDSVKAHQSQLTCEFNEVSLCSIFQTLNCFKAHAFGRKTLSLSIVQESIFWLIDADEALADSQVLTNVVWDVHSRNNQF